jgi:hypothetical protein
VMTGGRSRSLLMVAALVALLSLGGGVAAAAVWHPHASPHRSDRSNVPPSGVSIQAVWDDQGNPALVANFSPNGALAKPSWSICAPAQPVRCAPVLPHSQFLNAGPTPAGTVFQARAVYRHHVYVGRTTTWLGTVQAISLPTVTGAARYGSLVTPRPGRWSGGWKAVAGYRGLGGSSGGRGPSSDELSVEACQTSTAERCVNLTPQDEKAPDRARLGAELTGCYLFAIDQRDPPDVAFRGVGYLNAASVPIPRTGATIARSASLGPVVGPPRATVSILPQAISRDGRALVARVRCSVRCVVVTQVIGKEDAFGQVTLPPAATKLMSVPVKTLLPGRFTVRLFIGDGPAINGRTEIR